MATLKRVWVGAFVLALLVASVLAEHGGATDDVDSSGKGKGKQGPKPGKGKGKGKGGGGNQPKPGKGKPKYTPPPPSPYIPTPYPPPYTPTPYPPPYTPPPGNGSEPNVTAFLNAINGGNALEAQPTSVCIRFYQQFFNGTEVQTVAPVGPNDFGRIDVFEVNVTRTADPNSQKLGMANGVLLYDSQEFPAYDNKWTLTFSNESGLPANSSINFEGFEPDTAVFPEPYNYSVVGGTGAFACARGVVTEFVAFSNETLETDGDIACFVVGCGFNPADAFYLFSSQGTAAASVNA